MSPYHARTQHIQALIFHSTLAISPSQTVKLRCQESYEYRKLDGVRQSEKRRDKEEKQHAKEHVFLWNLLRKDQRADEDNSCASSSILDEDIYTELFNS